MKYNGTHLERLHICGHVRYQYIEGTSLEC